MTDPDFSLLSDEELVTAVQQKILENKRNERPIHEGIEQQYIKRSLDFLRNPRKTSSEKKGGAKSVDLKALFS